MSAPVADLHALAASHDIIAIGMLADEERRRRHGARTTYVRVATVPAEVDAPVIVPPASGEVRIVGVPASRAQAIERVQAVSAAASGVPVSGFSLADLEALAVQESITLRQLLEELCAVGLELVAEAPIDRLGDPRRAVEQVNIAGMMLARLTVDQVTTDDVPAFLLQVAALQQQVGVVRAFAPLPRRLNPLLPTTGYDDVKRVALARLFVDNVASIQVDWSQYGPKLAQVALTVGANDVDGVSAVDDTAEGPRRTARREIERQIRAAGLDPVERNGRFEPLAG